MIVTTFAYDEYHMCLLMGTQFGTVIRLFFGDDDSERDDKIVEEGDESRTFLKIMWCLEVMPVEDTKPAVGRKQREDIKPDAAPLLDPLAKPDKRSSFLTVNTSATEKNKRVSIVSPSPDSEYSKYIKVIGLR